MKTPACESLDGAPRAFIMSQQEVVVDEGGATQRKTLEDLHAWSGMDRETRAVICHFHVQLSDPLYRAFTGDH
ncbi:MAG: hypothetical protein KDC95_13040, partial [Planctomycetes bacterium]|nr:hypothetical protein [Planctomycetota bacterium]